MKAKEYPILELAGSAYDCGLSYGQQAAGLIAQSVEVYLRIIAHHTGLDRDQALQMSMHFLPAVQEHTPELEQELRGVAEGAGLTLEEILLLNCRTEVLSTVPLHECTAISAIPPATQQNAFLGQTWDWLRATAGLPMLLKIRQPGKPEVVTLVEAGQLGKLGMNASGLGLCLNWLEADHRGLGLPVHLFCRALLNQPSPAEAMNLLFRTPRGAAAGYVLASKAGFSIALEATAGAVGYIEPDQGLLVHTNHFLDDRLRAYEHGLFSDGAGSLLRRQRALRLLSSTHGQIDRMTLESVQADTHCGPSSISQSTLGSLPAIEDYVTLAGVVMDLSRGEMFLASGAPSETPFVKVHG